MQTGDPDLLAFEAATKDLVGVALRSLESFDDVISLPQFRLLLVLHDKRRSHSTEVARALGLAGSSVTRMADRLVAAGHVVRGVENSNRSVVTLELSKAGEDLVRRVTEHRRKQLAQVLDVMDPAVRSACAHGLAQLHAQLGDDHAIGLRSVVPL